MAAHSIAFHVTCTVMDKALRCYSFLRVPCKCETGKNWHGFELEDSLSEQTNEEGCVSCLYMIYRVEAVCCGSSVDMNKMGIH